ncbi:MAG: carbamoyl-phosphate synthase large subunit [Thermoplasmata archaeon]|nr:MAG: carbamoyl-phosphate synthase large subunit [Thermoplasmata archaeon]
MIIGSGPIIIGQAAEFDFSGSQACQSVREEGYKTVLVNSNPATIQTDMEMADTIYIEPLTLEFVERIIEKEQPDGILSGMGGQTALNICSELAERGILKKYDVELLGTQLEAIATAEDRDLFRTLMNDINEPVPKSRAVNSIEEAIETVPDVNGYPVLIRPAYTLGGTGGGIAHNKKELESVVGRGLVYSRIHQVLIEESVLGWKEYEYEVMRDSVNTCITVCNMENLDMMGIHTGESIVIAPAQTLSDEDHQMLRSAALKIIRALKIEGGCNIQFALNHDTGEYRVIEVNPRVSRSSALASKATGYPIARVAAKIAVGLKLDEIPNSITGKTYASFEPTLDYVIMKIPRWPFDKFITADMRIGTQMKSTGEVMAIGRNVEESLQKAIRSLEIDKMGFERLDLEDNELIQEMKYPSDKRLFAIAEALRRGFSPEEIEKTSGYDTFFIKKIQNILNIEELIKKKGLSPHILKRAKKFGFSDEHLASLINESELEIRKIRNTQEILPAYKMVDTCAAEFAAETPYYYSTYASECESIPSKQKKIIIVGSGPIRIGQGIEFDYSCVHAVLALREEGIEAIMVNNNPETVSTDYDISDKLYFEPLTFEDVMNIIEKENPDGIILQFGGQTSINLANPLYEALSKDENLKTKILGTSPKAIDLAEDRKKFEALMRKLGISQPKAGTGFSFDEVRHIADEIEYPVLVRPSYVLGGRAMEIVHDEEELKFYMSHAVKVSKDHPILVDKFLSNAIEIDVDAVCDGKDVFIGAIMEHIEEAGVHSGDSFCVIPAQTLSEEVLKTVRDYTRKIALSLGVVGLLNIQFAVQNDTVYVLEANPRASRTVPFVSKTIGVPMAKLATKVIIGHNLMEMGFVEEVKIDHVCVKAPVFPFLKLPGVDTILTPEMKSTGEVMGLATTFGAAYYKSVLSAEGKFVSEGTAYVTVNDEDKPKVLPIAKELKNLGFNIVSTKGTASYLRENGIEAETVWTITEPYSPDALDLMRRGKIDLIINTPMPGGGPKKDGHVMRRLAVELVIPFITTIPSAWAAIEAIKSAKKGVITVKSLNEYCAS